MNLLEGVDLMTSCQYCGSSRHGAGPSYVHPQTKHEEVARLPVRQLPPLILKIALTILFSAVCLSVEVFGQHTSVLRNYEAAVNKFTTVMYNIQRIDTFTTGSVWNHKASCFLDKENNKGFLGFRFAASRPDLDEETIYDGSEVFVLDHKSMTYTIEKSPGRGILGSPGGQMVVEEFVRIDTGYTSVRSYKERDDYVLRFNFPDDHKYDISEHHKLLYLDDKSFLPTKIVVSLLALGKKQVTVKILSHLETNIRDIDTQFDKKVFLRSYIPKMSTPEPAVTLVGSAAYEFSLKSFDGSPVTLRNYRGKIIMLDFWEIWCAPCVESMPEVDSLYHKYRERGLVVLGIMSEVESLESAKLLVRKKDVSYPNVVGNDSVKKQYNVRGIPKYILIDEQGKIIYESTNGFEEKLVRMLRDKFSRK